MEASNIIVGEGSDSQHQQWRKAGTYVITGERGSKEVFKWVCSQEVAVGDIVIIIAYAQMELEEAKAYKPNYRISGYRHQFSKYF